MENKNLTVVMIISVISILLISVGITYAYFSAFNSEGSTAEIVSETGKMIISYDDGTDSIEPVNNIFPSDNILVNKTFTLTGINTTSGLAMPYNIGIEYTSSFSDGMIHYYIKEIDRVENSNVTVEYMGTTNQTMPGNNTYTGYSHGTFKYGNKYTEMIAGEFPSSTSDQTITFNLIIQFPDTGENQDSEKGKKFNGKIKINNESNKVSQVISELYDNNKKNENGITIDGLQKDGTGIYNIKNLGMESNNYNVSLLNNAFDTNADIYDNLRYVGDSPNNYIIFNDEIWRIIGIFNVFNVISNKYENLVKIIRNEALGTYSWDITESTINKGLGINEWSQADIMYELNCDGSGNVSYCRDDITDGYLSNLTSGTANWYYENGIFRTYEYSKNIKEDSINKIATVRWNLGGYKTAAVSALNIYNYERETAHVSSSNDGITRTNYWDGKVALMYPSDYGFASTDELCRNQLNYSADDIQNCKNNNWLYNSSYQWTLTPGSEVASRVYIVSGHGEVTQYNGATSRLIRPVLFLKSDTKILSGTGTSDDPYIIN